MFELGDVGDRFAGVLPFGEDAMVKCKEDGGRTGDVTGLGIRDLIAGALLLSSLPKIKFC